MATGGALPRLAPLDHVRALYKDAEALLPGDRPITRKQDLIRAVRAMSPGVMSRKVPTAHTTSTSSLPSVPPSASTGGPDMTRLTTGAPVLADALDSTARTVADLEHAVNASTKAYNEVKLKVTARQRKLQDLKTELASLRNENNTLAAVEARTHLLGVGMSGSSTPTAATTSGGTRRTFMPPGNSLVSEVAALIDLDDASDSGEGSDASGGGVEWSLRMNSSTSDRHNRAQTLALLTKSQRVTASAAEAANVPPAPATVSTFSAAAFPSITMAMGTIAPPPPPSDAAVAAAAAAAAPASKSSATALNALLGNAGISLTLTPVELAEVERIRSLRKQIKAVRRSMAKRDFTRRQYEYMAARLRGNASAFERHMKGLDDAIRAARKELNDVSGYLRMLETSKDAAVSDMHKLQAHLGSERAARARDLDERRLELARASQMEVWRKQRAAVRAEMRAELAGDLSREQEEQLLATLRTKETALVTLQAERRAREERAAALQDAFVRIRAATGVNNLDEMVERFLSAPALRAALEREKSETEARLNASRDALEAAQKEYDELKASGGSAATAASYTSRGDDSFKDEMDRLERTLTGARSVLKLHRSGVERLEGILLTVRQGAVGLATMCEPFKELLPHSVQVAMALASVGDGSNARPQSMSMSRSPALSGVDGGGGMDSPRSSIGSPRLLDVRRHGNETLKYLSRVEASLNGMIDILARAVREHIRGGDVDAVALAAAPSAAAPALAPATPAEAEQLKLLEGLVKVSDEELRSVLTVRDDTAAGAAPSSAARARLAELLLHRASALRGLSVASLQMLAAGAAGPEPVAVAMPRPVSRAAAGAPLLSMHSDSVLPSLSAMPAAPNMPAAEHDVSLSSVTIAQQWKGAAASTPAAPHLTLNTASPGDSMLVDATMVHENNIRVSPRPMLEDTRTTLNPHVLAQARAAAHAIDVAHTASMAAAVASGGSTADDASEGGGDVDVHALRTGVIPSATARMTSPTLANNLTTKRTAVGVNNDAVSARGSVMSASSARIDGHAPGKPARFASVASPGAGRASQHVMFSPGSSGGPHGNIHRDAPDEHALAALAALGLSNLPSHAHSANSGHNEEDDVILDRFALKRRAAEHKAAEIHAVTSAAAAAAAASAVPAAAGAVHPSTAHPGARASDASGALLGPRASTVGATAAGRRPDPAGHVSGLAYLTQRPKMN